MKRIGAFTLLHQMEKVAAPERKVKEILQFFGKSGRKPPERRETMDGGQRTDMTDGEYRISNKE